MFLFQHKVRALNFLFGVVSISLIVAPTSFGANEIADAFKEGSVWKGQLLVEKGLYLRKPQPNIIILYVKQRKTTAFEGLVWYPNANNRILKVSGKLGKDGTISFREEKLIHDDVDRRLAPGWQFKGIAKNLVFEGSVEWAGPNFNGPITGRFSLTLAR